MQIFNENTHVCDCPNCNAELHYIGDGNIKAEDIILCGRCDTDVTNRIYIKSKKSVIFHLIIVILACIILFSCSKEYSQENDNSKAVTYLLDVYNADWQYIRTDTSIHWHSVSGERLAWFEAQSKAPILVCSGETNMIRLVIGKDMCKIKN